MTKVEFKLYRIILQEAKVNFGWEVECLRSVVVKNHRYKDIQFVMNKKRFGTILKVLQVNGMIDIVERYFEYDKATLEYIYIVPNAIEKLTDIYLYEGVD